MAGPWDKYQMPAESGPWAKYGAPVSVEQPPAAEDDWQAAMKARVAAASKDTREGKEFTRARESLRAMTRGALGIGSYLDEADAFTNALVAPVVDPILPESFHKLPQEDFADRYDAALKIQRDQDKKFDEENPLKSKAMRLAGGLMSGGALVKAAPVTANVVLGNWGKFILPRLAGAGVSGATIGAVQGFGDGEGVEDRLSRAGQDAAVGAVLGPAATALGALGGKAIELGRDYLVSPKVLEALAGMSRGARKYIDRELADPAKVEAMKAQIDKLGPDAMMADVSPEWFGVARGAASKPGTRDLVVKPLEDRAAAANARLRGDVETSLGPDPIPSEIQTGIEGDRDLVSRLYGPAFAERQPYDFTPITNDLDRSIVNLRGDAQRVLQRVRGMMNTHGTDEVTNDPSVAFQTRQAIDGLLANETNPKVVNALSEARQMVDDGLTRSVPRIKEIDAQYHELSRQIEGLGRGRPILNNEASAMRPSELEQELVEGGQPHGMLVGPSAEALRARQGTVGEVYRAIGTKANDTTALRNIVRGEGDWNRSKLALLFGQKNADDALNAIDREIKFGDTANRITRNSETAVTNRFGDFLDEAGKPMTVPADTTLTGLGLKAGHGVLKALMRSNAEGDAARYAQDLASLSVAKGGQRDAIISALINRGKHLEELKDPKMAKLVQALLQTTARSATPMLPSPLQ